MQSLYLQVNIQLFQQYFFEKTVFFSNVLSLLSSQKWVEVIQVSLLLSSLFCHICLCDVWIRMSHTGTDIWILVPLMVELFRQVVHSWWRKYVPGFRLWELVASFFFQITLSASWAQNIWSLSFLLWLPAAIPCFPYHLWTYLWNYQPK